MTPMESKERVTAAVSEGREGGRVRRFFKGQ